MLVASLRYSCLVDNNCACSDTLTASTEAYSSQVGGMNLDINYVQLQVLQISLAKQDLHFVNDFSDWHHHELSGCLLREVLPKGAHYQCICHSHYEQVNT